MFLTTDFIHTFFHVTHLQPLQGRVPWREGCGKERSRVKMTLPSVLTFLRFLSYFLSASFSSVYSCFLCITGGDGAESYCIMASEDCSEPWIKRRNIPSSHGEGPSAALEWLAFGVLLVSLPLLPKPRPSVVPVRPCIGTSRPPSPNLNTPLASCPRVPSTWSQKRQLHSCWERLWRWPSAFLTQSLVPSGVISLFLFFAFS